MSVDRAICDPVNPGRKWSRVTLRTDHIASKVVEGHLPTRSTPAENGRGSPSDPIDPRRKRSRATLRPDHIASKVVEGHLPTRSTPVESGRGSPSDPVTSRRRWSRVTLRSGRPCMGSSVLQTAAARTRPSSAVSPKPCDASCPRLLASPHPGGLHRAPSTARAIVSSRS
jgi:hypothetical protein